VDRTCDNIVAGISRFMIQVTCSTCIGNDRGVVPATTISRVLTSSTDLNPLAPQAMHTVRSRLMAPTQLNLLES
jgi:hypothetical protein